MKTLKEEIDAIKNANISKAAKKNALIALGLRPYEVVIEMASLATPASPRTPAFTFGVEIECGVSRNAFIEAANRLGVRYEYERYNHRDGHSYYKFTSDASLIICDAIECVSPVLKGANGKKSLKTTCDALNEAGARVNSTCGLHVHIGAADLTEQQYCNVFNNYYFLEGIIDRFMAASRRADSNQFCRTVQDHSRLTGCTTAEDVRDELSSRYHKVNAESYLRHRTIEFRQHQGTTNYEKIINWVTFCGKLVEWSKKNRLTAHVTDINDVAFLTKKEKEFFGRRIAELA